MNVLSLFDGMSCGQIALKKLGIKVDNYIASEIEEFAIKATQFNFPNTLQVGNVMDLSFNNGILFSKEIPIFDTNIHGKIDLFIGGSPCTNLSNAGDKSGLIANSLQDYFDLKNNNHDFGKNTSFLFWEYCRLLNEINPTHFLLENVKMKKEYEDTITSTIKSIRNEEVSPIMINSNFVSAQDRKRLYWTNIPNVGQPEKKNLKIRDILDDVENPKYDVTERYLKKVVGTLAHKKARSNRRTINQTSKTLTTSGHGISNSGSTNIYFAIDDDLKDESKMIKVRVPSPTECERLQTVPEGYTSCLKERQRYSVLGNGWTVDVIAHIFKNIIQESE